MDERFSGILDFGDGVVATPTSGFRSDHSSIEAIGSAGSLRLDDPFAVRATRLIGSDGYSADTAANSMLPNIRPEVSVPLI